MLGESQSEHNKKRHENEVAAQMVNGVLAQEKKQRDLELHQEWAKLEAREIAYTNNTDFMTENPATEVSMLAPHRVKPYHFKGFNQERIE